jgi:hypothetical protein
MLVTVRSIHRTLDPWYYWLSGPPDQRTWRTVECQQGDEEAPFDGYPVVSRVDELLALERDGWLTVGVWWRPIDQDDDLKTFDSESRCAP